MTQKIVSIVKQIQWSVFIFRDAAYVITKCLKIFIVGSPLQMGGTVSEKCQ